MNDRTPRSASAASMKCETLDELFTHCFPAFGGAFLRRIYTILDRAIGTGCPLTLAVSGPVTVSGQHQAWLIPLLEAGWIAYLSTTDAACYHDGHRSLDAHRDPGVRSPHLGRRRRAARRAHHSRHRHGVQRGRAARSGQVPLRGPAASRIPAPHDRHRAALSPGSLLRRAGTPESRPGRPALHLPPPGDPDLRGRGRRRQHFSELDEAVGHEARPAWSIPTSSSSTCTPKSTRPARIIAGGCSTIRPTRWRR